MSITAETAKEHANDPAVLCCRAEEGVTIEASNLEDPTIFDDLVDTGLLNLDGCLKIGQILGSKLTKTCDSLTPLTADVVDQYKDAVEEAVEDPANNEAKDAVPAVAPANASVTTVGGTLKIYIQEGKDIRIELPTACTK